MMSFISRVNVVMVAVGALLVVEAGLRFGLGLGSPPLSEISPYYEYRFRPNQNLKRFGNLVRTNQWGMRSAPMQPLPSRGVRRILVFGDSVIFGGVEVDQSRIATSLLLGQLRQEGETVELGNVSAGSWGPGNWKGWAERFGFLGASDILLVISTHDARDNPTFAPLNPQTHPTHPPLSAIGELFSRYLNIDRVIYQLRSWHLLPLSAASLRTFERNLAGNKLSDSQSDDLRRGLADLRAFLLAARRSGAHVRVLQFWERQEVQSQRPFEGHQAVLEAVQGMGIPVVQSLPSFQGCSRKSTSELFVDTIHPYTLEGQACLAKAMKAALAR